MKELLEEFKKGNFSSKECMNIVHTILENEFSSPRTQKEIDYRIKSLKKIFKYILEEQFAPEAAMLVLSDISLSFFTKYPQLIEQETVEDYIT